MRSTAVLGVCKILAKCWELLPPSIITDFLKKLVMEMATDCRSPDVRCAVFKVDDLVALRSALSRSRWWCNPHAFGLALSVCVSSWTTSSAIQSWKGFSPLSNTAFTTTRRRSAQPSWTCSSR